MAELLKCKCGGQPVSSCDGCGHEWVDCKKCGKGVETYEADDDETSEKWNSVVRSDVGLNSPKS